MATEPTPGDFGSKLREARERRGVTLRQIANATKISFGQLESLEKNNISKLPGGIFTRAFVRSYALEVGLDPETTVQEFIAQFPHDSVTIGHLAPGQVEDNEAVESDRRMAGTLLWLLVISIPVAAAVLYFSMAGRHAPPPPAETAPSASSIPPPSTTPEPSAEPSAPETSPLPPVPGAPEASNAAPAQPAAAAVATAPTPGATTPTGEVLLVGVSARRPCWVSATVDGQRVIERLMAVGEERALNVRRELVITAGDASAIALTLNGADARLLGRSGEVVTVRINLNNFKSYLQAR